jgi:ribosomal protein L37AE/L43A
VVLTGRWKRKLGRELRETVAEGTEDDTSEIDCASCGHIALTSTSVERHEIQIKGFTSQCSPRIARVIPSGV